MPEYMPKWPLSAILEPSTVPNDVNMRDRAASSTAGKISYPELAQLIKLQFMTDAVVLRDNAKLSEELVLDAHVPTFSSEANIGLALSTFRGEFAAFNETLQRRYAAEHSSAKPSRQSTQCWRRYNSPMPFLLVNNEMGCRI
jgi:hypothetical protein